MKSVVQVTDAIKNIKDLEDFQLAQKATLTGIIMAIIKAEPTDSLVSPVRTMAVDALSYLSKLKPFYSTEESIQLAAKVERGLLPAVVQGRGLTGTPLWASSRITRPVLRLRNEPLSGVTVNSSPFQVMSDPILHQKKLLKRAVLMLEKGAEQEDEVLRVLSLRALGNMALGAPRKVRQYRKLLLEKCLSSLRGPSVSTSVTSEGLEVLAKVLVELREGDLGSAFNAISEQCRAFFDNESKLLRLKAFILFGKLAQVVRISKKHFFKQEVKKAWVPLMLHCQDPCSDAAQACVATLFQCVHFWGWRALESSADHSDATAPKEMAGFQMTLCSILTQKKPAVLYNFLLETMTYVKSNLSRIRIAACNLAGIIMKQMSAHYLKKLDFPALRNSLQELQLDSDPGVWRAALETLNILDTCSQQRLLASPEGIA
ncbi:LOW QUALITY PROTEIN: maestro heat-like repeat-containing protein family member 2A [Cervus elaphus]|uniref:LOW QUALITY PROTEIN: maestro heat-like repeat-containing protein family member 2A n=1 Tax=Cervus elaphus TaxID=9860 RepID=UPI001CC2A1E4|nr:LOW QUALITY PROTEIN: maestro heat-like repeat-containing protein family member 2A [Cervus elaphus]